ncbi:MAG: hypothetical protein HRT71_21470 [Flavobacteriales bacterium]|nr:hypothetical protein [Flavobacteriales bacterium]
MNLKDITHVFRSQKLSVKLNFYAILGILIVVISIMTVSIQTANSVVSNKVFEILENKLSLRSNQISKIFGDLERDVLRTKHNLELQEMIAAYKTENSEIDNQDFALLIASLKEINDLTDIEVLDLDGKIIYRDTESLNSSNKYNFWVK